MGEAAGRHTGTELVLDGLAMVVGRRCPARGLVNRSDAGGQYASHRCQRVVERHGMVPSMGRRGDCRDNAMAESSLWLVKTELVGRRPWAANAA